MLKEVYNLADNIWDHPELGFDEHQSASYMTDFLKNQGFTLETGIANMETAYVATYGQGKPVISFLCEYDALPGLNQQANCLSHTPITNENDNGHGCGHHLLGTGAIYGALLYKKYLEENNLPGTIKVFGCPGEEAGSGKAYLARDGYFKDTDIALTWHPGTINKVVTGSSQSCMSIYFRFTGISSHAAGSPELGRSALDTAELMNVGVNYLREHMADSDRVHYAYIDAGGKAPNVVQANATLKYFVRSKNNPECIALSKRVIDCAKGAALMTGCKYEVIFDEGLSNTIPNKVLEDVLANSFRKNYQFDYTEEELAYLQKYKDTTDIENALKFIPDNTVDPVQLAKDMKESPVNSYFVETTHSESCNPGSTDVGDVSWVVPTGQVNTACYAYGAFGHTWQWVAQGKSSTAHKGLKLAGEILADAAIELYNNPELIAKAKAEFDSRMDGQSYECLIPADVKPHIYNF